LTAWPEKVYINVVEGVNLFHPEALEKGIETPINPGPFVLPGRLQGVVPSGDMNLSANSVFQKTAGLPCVRL